MHVWMQGRCVAIEGDEDVMFMQAFEQAAAYYTVLVSPHIPLAEAATPRTIEELKQLFRAACTEFSRGSALGGVSHAARRRSLHSAGPGTARLWCGHPQVHQAGPGT